jgi:hypothetical protein
VLLSSFDLTQAVAMPLAMSLAFLLRGLAIVYDLRLSKYGQ